MEIVCSADNNYVMPIGIMLTSLLENNKDTKVNVHLLDGGLTDLSKSQLSDICNQYNQHISFYPMDDKLFENFPMGESFQETHINSMATYYRLYMSKVLPKDIDKVIYLDGDIIILDSLLDMWNYPMEGKPIAAVPDPFNNSVRHYNRLRYSQALGYFNAGVLLVDLKYWRDNNCLELFLDIVQKYRTRLSAFDQDVLNVAFMNKKLFLPLKYNAMPCYLFKIQYNPISWEFEEEIAEAQKHPVVVHFSYVPKPWNCDCNNPYKEEFEKYKKMTIWSERKEPRASSLREVILNNIRKIMVRLGWKSEDCIDEYKYIRRVGS